MQKLPLHLLLSHLLLVNLYLPKALIMFAEAAVPKVESPSKQLKTAAGSVPTAAGEEGAGGSAGLASSSNADDRILVKEMAKLLLQHEDTMRSNTQDQNVVLELEQQSTMKASMDRALEQYDEAGKVAREAAKEKGVTFMGNPQGKKPDTLLRAVIYHLHFALLKKPDVVMEGLGDEGLKEVKAAAEIVVEAGK